jgi:hypothetical protein
MNITTGKVSAPICGLLYGPEGIGKTTFAAAWPRPLFIDIENGSNQYDVARTDRPTSWNMLVAIIAELTKGAHGYQTIVIDTADWAAQLCAAHVVANAKSDKIKSIEDFGYGKGMVMAAEEWKRFLDMLTALQANQRVNVLFLAHAIMRKFEQPDEIGAYDRWEMKMEKKSSSLLKEWADIMLFANYETFVIEADGKKKGQGGKRVMHTQHHPCWDGKNRYGLPEKVAFDFASIAGIFATAPSATMEKKVEPPKTPTAPTAPKQAAPVPTAPVCDNPDLNPAPEVKPEVKPEAAAKPEYIPQALWDLMQMAKVSEADVRAAVEYRGYYPAGTPFAAYDPSFVLKSLIPGWTKVLAIINEIKKG